MKIPRQIKDAIESNLISEALYPMLEPLILKVYYMGYADAVDIYQLAIDMKNLRETWDNG